MSVGKLVIYSHQADYTTARYFESAARRLGYVVVYRSETFDVRTLKFDDVFLFIDPVTDWPIGLEMSPCLKIAYLIDVHLQFEIRSQLCCFFDAIFLSQKDYKAKLEADGHRNVFWLPLAADPEVHFSPGLPRTVDVAFVGKMGLPGTSRHEVLTYVLSRFKTNPLDTWMAPPEMGRIYSSAKLVFNKSINGDVNMRVFEAMSSGAMLVTDHVANGMQDMFVEGQHYIGYSSSTDAVEKISWFLNNDEKRTEIATAGQDVVQRNHTYQTRVKQMFAVVSESDFRGDSLACEMSRGQLGNLYLGIFVVLKRPARIFVLMCRYGFSWSGIAALAGAVGKILNQWVPITAGARNLRRSQRSSGRDRKNGSNNVRT
jgi:glycosyltransferase involved in cell wall biosynthesis